MTADNRFPEFVSLYPVMAARAARRASSVGGGYRLYLLAKALDRQGLGAVPLAELREYARSLGLSAAQFRRWISEARNNDLLSDYETSAGVWMVIIRSAAKAAYALGCKDVGACKVSMKATDLMGAGWKGRIQAGFIAATRGRPMTRLTMRELTGVPQRTQRYREMQAGVTRTANYCESDFSAYSIDFLDSATESFSKTFPHKGVFITSDHKIAWRLPDIRTTDRAERIGRGRARKANATLHRMQHRTGSSILRRAFSDAVAPEIATNESVYVRIFNSTPDQRKASERKLARLDGLDVSEVYELSHESARGARMWRHCPR